MKKMFTLRGLAKAADGKDGNEGIDAWVEAISYVSDTKEGRRICPQDDCPAEHERELTDLADRLGLMFYADGEFAGVKK